MALRVFYVVEPHVYGNEKREHTEVEESSYEECQHQKPSMERRILIVGMDKQVPASFCTLCMHYKYYIIFISFSLLRTNDRFGFSDTLLHLRLESPVRRFVEILRFHSDRKVIRFHYTPGVIMRILISDVIALFFHAFHRRISNMVRHLERW